MPTYYVPVWKEAPFVRLVLPFTAGIGFQYYFDLSAAGSWWLAACSIAMLLMFGSVSSFIRFKNYRVSGVFINLLLFYSGCLITYYKDIRHHPSFIGHYDKERFVVTVRLQEPLSEKAASFKARASVESVSSNDSCKRLTGNILVYFKKHDGLSRLSYGSRVAFSQPLQAVSNTGNPGAFDYKRYCALQNIYHQVFLNPSQYIILPATDINLGEQWLFRIRENILMVLREYIPGKKECGLAEALLIGYKDDLDKTLVQSYSNTGVVHIIAISGLHLGLVYGLLILVCKPFERSGYIKRIKPVFIITGLWLFSLLAGGSASVLRSAVMFSFIALGEGIGKRTFIYNSLAASAFLLLCYNPFWLWDAGFQLSYSAVLSIVIFMRPVYNWIIIQNKMLDYIWKLNAITLAAQVLTAPVSIYHFHQFPVYFPLTNLLAVPLSALIVLTEIWLCACSGISWMAEVTGSVIYYLIKAMNAFIAHMEGMPFSTWDQLQLSFLQLILFYTGIAAVSVYLFYKTRMALIAALFSAFIFMGLRSFSLHRAYGQNKLIVYNIARHQAIDVIQGRQALFIGNEPIPEGSPIYRFHIRSSRILHRISRSEVCITDPKHPYGFTIQNKIIILNKPLVKTKDRAKYIADIVILSGNPQTTVSALLKTVNCKLLVFDSSNPAWKINKWKAECSKYHLPYFSVSEKGAFIVNLN